MFKSFTASDKKLPAGRKRAAVDPALPPTMQWAVRLMLVGAAISTLYLVFALIITASVKSALVRWNATQTKKLTGAQINSLATYYIVSTIVIGLIAIGLWLWMARVNSAGRKWGRIAASVLFLLWTYYTYVSIGQTRGAAALIISTVIVLLIWLAGLGSLFLIWRPASSAFYNAQSS